MKAQRDMTAGELEASIAFAGFDFGIDRVTAVPLILANLPALWMRCGCLLMTADNEKPVQLGDCPQHRRPFLFFPLNIDEAQTEVRSDPFWIARIVHRCGCRAYWDALDGARAVPGTWLVALNSPWRICAAHRDDLRGVKRPVFDTDCSKLGGFSWAE